jgi:hypothetical protein
MKNRVLLENYFLPGDLERKIEAFVDHYNNHQLPREPGQPDARRRLSRSRCKDPENAREDQETDNQKTPVAAPSRRRINSNRNRTRASVTIQPQLSEKL